MILRYLEQFCFNIFLNKLDCIFSLVFPDHLKYMIEKAALTKLETLCLNFSLFCKPDIHLDGVNVLVKADLDFVLALRVNYIIISCTFCVIHYPEGLSNSYQVVLIFFMLKSQFDCHIRLLTIKGQQYIFNRYKGSLTQSQQSKWDS